MTASEVRCWSQWAMVESGTIAPLLEGVGAAGAAGAAASPPVDETAEVEDAAEVMPVRVPEEMEAAVVDSPVAAAMAAILVATSAMFEVVLVDVGADVVADVVDVVVDAVVADVVADVLDVTSWPPDVAKTAGAALEAAEAGTVVVAAAPAVVVAAGVVVPRVATEAGAPVMVLALM